VRRLIDPNAMERHREMTVSRPPPTEGYTLNVIMRHELAHSNGWSHLPMLEKTPVRTVP
jgi:hypothetical protein